MILRILGAVLILSACGYVGFHYGIQHRRREESLEQLILALEYMCRELEYTLLPLPQLCRQGAEQCSGLVSQALSGLAYELDRQVSADAQSCMDAALLPLSRLPECTKEKLELLGKSLGQFDLSGQISGMQSVTERCRRDLEGLYANHDVRIRSYRTLGLCAGAALVILFI